MNKKTVLALLLSFCSCGSPKTLDEACDKADRLVREWDRKTIDGNGYKGEYSEDSNAFIVTTYSLTVADETDFAKASSAPRRCEFIYDGLKDIFSEFDVHIVAIVIDENQEAYYATVDGTCVDVGGI